MKPGINVLLAFMLIASFLCAIALHELAHVLMARWLGDRTPVAEGRQTLNIRAHIDPVGTLLCVLLAFYPISLSTLPIGLGWGKPVKADPWKMRVGADRGVLLVALAGLLFSLLIGIVIAVIVRFTAPFFLTNTPFTPFTDRILQLLIVFAVVNVALAFFNLLPLYPLDGYQILYTLLPNKQAVAFSRSASFGPFVILLLFFLLPFLANLAGLGSVEILHPAVFFTHITLNLLAPIIGIPSDGLANAYAF